LGRILPICSQQLSPSDPLNAVKFLLTLGALCASNLPLSLLFSNFLHMSSLKHVSSTYSSSWRVHRTGTSRVHEFLALLDSFQYCTPLPWPTFKT
jgi:hypothetical protein